MTGEVESQDGVLVIRRIHVAYRIAAEAEHTDAIDRVHRVHARYCPVYQSISGAISISTEYERVEPAQS